MPNPINLNSKVFSEELIASGKVTSSLVASLNTSPLIQKLFEIADQYSTKIYLAEPKEGTSFQPRSNRILIDPEDFALSSSTIGQGLLALRIAHELAHAADHHIASTLSGTNGLAISPGTGGKSDYLGPHDYIGMRAQDEGFAQTIEYRAARELGIDNFSGGPARFETLLKIDSALGQAGASQTSIDSVLTYVAGSLGRLALPSTNASAGAKHDRGLKYEQENFKLFVLRQLGFTDANGRAINTQDYPNAGIYVDNLEIGNAGDYKINAYDFVKDELITKVYQGDGRSSQLFATIVVKVTEDGYGTETTTYADSSRAPVVRTFNANGDEIPRVESPGLFQKLWNSIFGSFTPAPQSLDMNADGTADATLAAAPAIDGMNFTFEDANGSLTLVIRDDEMHGTVNDIPADGGLTRIIDTVVQGQSVQVTQHLDNSDLADDTDGDGDVIDPGEAVTTNFLINGQEAVNEDLLSRSFDVLFPDAMGFIDAAGNGDALQLVAAGDPGNPTGERELPASDGEDWTSRASQLRGLLTSSQALVAAVETGDSLAIATAAFNLVDTAIGGLGDTLGYLGTTLNSATALVGLARALDRGDPLAALNSGLSLSREVLQGMQNAIDQQIQLIISINGPAAVADPGVQSMQQQSAELAQMLKGLQVVLVVINVYYHLKNEDYIGAALTAWAAYSGDPYVIIAAMIWDFAQAWEEPDFHGEARLASGGADGTEVAVVATGELGGDEPAGAVMADLLKMLQKELEQLPGFAIVAERVPELRVDGAGLHITVVDPLTGQVSERTFDANCRMIGETLDGEVLEPAGSLNFYRNLYEQFIRATYEAGALRLAWEAQTVHLQRQNGVAQAGLTTLERARADGTLLNPSTDLQTQTLRPLVLDLGGDGTPALSPAKGGQVLFDVDDDGFAEKTNWVGPRDAVLVLDRNGDGRIEGGHELFSDAGVDTGRRGLNVLAEIDADGNRLINALDPVFQHLQVWQDVDSDGVAQAHELRTLAELGITQLDFQAGGSFTRDGAERPLVQASLIANTDGTLTQLREGDLWTLDEDAAPGTSGHLYTLTVEDLSKSGTVSAQIAVSADGSLAAGFDGLRTDEDTPLSVSTAQLLANDSIADGAGEMHIASVAIEDASLGSVSLSADGDTVVFTPAANFHGEVRFNYTLSNGRGQLVTGRATVTVRPVNDAPTAVNRLGDARLLFAEMETVASPDGSSGLTYSFTKHHQLRLGEAVGDTAGVVLVNARTWDGGDQGTWQGGLKIGGTYYSIGRMGDAMMAGLGGQWFPILKTDPYIHSGSIVASDVDTPASGLKFKIIRQREDYGTAVIDPDTGAWTFTYKPHGASSGINTNEGDAAFIVRVSDGEGDDAAYTDVEMVLGGRALERWDRREAGDTLLDPDFGQRRNEGVGGQGAGAGAAIGMGRAGAQAAAAASAPPRRDPLALDLDGDGIETLGERNGRNILFDHDADGVRTGTGWLMPDDAWLALDLDGNGRIDSGRELFGVDTVLSNGGFASDGYAALRDRDSNRDGVIDATDAVFNQLLVWRDLNQDGVSQAGELGPLAAHHIVSIGVTATAQRTDLGNGNVQTAVGSYRRSDGSQGSSAGTEYTAANLDLLVNTFQRSFNTPVETIEATRKLQPVRGSGQVRDLREAASLSPALLALVQQYNGLTSRDAQLGALDQLMQAWADTSAMRSLKQQAEALEGSGVRLSYNLSGLTAGTAAYDEFIRKLGVVERFMGFTYAGTFGQPSYVALGASAGALSVWLSSDQIQNVTLAYERFKGDFYESSLLNSRLKGYTALIELQVIDGQDVMSFEAVAAAFEAAIAADPSTAVKDLIEFISALGEDRMLAHGWDAMGFLAKQLERASALPGYTQALSSWSVRIAGAGEREMSGSAQRDLIIGSNGGDTLRGAAGDDLLFGMGGDDALYGGAGNDSLDGGAGNDRLEGGTGNNTYLFGRGDGQDVVRYWHDATPGKLNTLQFKAGVNVGDVQIRQVDGGQLGSRTALEFAIAGTTDRIVFNGFFYLDDPSSAYNGLQQVKFADGTTWDLHAIKAALFAGTAGTDEIAGTVAADTIYGQDGADTLHGRAGNDFLDGGAGADKLYGETGDDTLDGGAGNDTLDGGTGNNTYLFGRGDGQDVVRYWYDATPGKLNTLQFKAGVAAGDIQVRQVNGHQLGSMTALEFSIAGSDERIIFNGFFYLDDPSSAYNGLQQVKFADGTTWDLEGIKAAVFAGTAGVDEIAGTVAADMIHGQGGADTLRGRAGNDVLNGGAGDDTLYGEGGDDTLDGGAGNDVLEGAAGDNTYVFGRSDGQDIVRYWHDATLGKLNTLQFKTGVSASDIQLRQGNGNQLGSRAALEFSIAGASDKIVFNGFFYLDDPSSAYNGLQQVKFADGTTWDLEGIKAALFAGTASADEIAGTVGADTINGQDGADTLHGRAGNDMLLGGEGADRLNGEAGDDTLDGGAGDDVLEGATGNNTYLFGRGDGQDIVRYWHDPTPGKLNTLQFKAGVSVGDVQIRQVDGTQLGSKTALEFSIAGTSDRIVFNGFFYLDDPSSAYNGLQQVKFADGTTWDLEAIKTSLFAGTASADEIAGTIAADTIYGQDGADTLRGRAGNDSLNGGAGDDRLLGEAGDDTLDGGAGNDSLEGGTGNNTYLFGRGDGQDLVRYSYDTTPGKLNTLQLKASVAAGDVQVRRASDNQIGGNSALEISIAGTTDKITFNGFFANNDPTSAYRGLQQIRFADGSIWDLAAIQAAARAAPAGATRPETDPATGLAWAAGEPIDAELIGIARFSAAPDTMAF